MQTVADAKYSEALANEIAAALNAVPHSPRVAVRFDRTAETWAVRITVEGVKFDLLMPAPDAHFALFRNNAWLGGVNLTTSAAPIDVAIATLDRISSAL